LGSMMTALSCGRISKCFESRGRRRAVDFRQKTDLNSREEFFSGSGSFADARFLDGFRFRWRPLVGGGLRRPRGEFQRARTATCGPKRPVLDSATRAHGWRCIETCLKNQQSIRIKLVDAKDGGLAFLKSDYTTAAKKENGPPETRSGADFGFFRL